MRIHSILVLVAGLALSLPLSAGHRHGGDCGHYFDSHRGGWFSVQIATPFGYGMVNRGFDRDRGFNRYDDRYDGRHYRDSHRYNKKFFKKMRRQQMRDHRRFYNQRHHVHGPQCWR